MYQFDEATRAGPQLTIYLDNMAATAIDPRVAEHHRAAMIEHAANPHSVEHKPGADARSAMGHASDSLLRSLDSRAEEVIFTPGASAALWLAVEDAIARTRGRSARVAATAVEHPALLAALRRAERDGRLSLTLLPVDDAGAPRLETIEAALATGLDLLCAMAANNELGTVTDTAAIGEFTARHGTRFLVDASQAAGRVEPAAFACADLLVVSGAKIHGPRRAGALVGDISRSAADLAHEVFGSPDAPAAIALAFALELRQSERAADEPRIGAMRDALEAHLVGSVPGLRVNGSAASRLAGSLHVSTPHLPGEAAVARLWNKVAVSTGAACQTGVPGPSHVLSAIDVPQWAREGAVRIGVGRFNTPDEIEAAGHLIAAALTTEPARMRA